MRVFVTGAAGFIGKGTVQELVKNGHQVIGLVRSDAQAEILTKLGAEPHMGSLEDLESLKSGAKKADGIVHLARIHDFSNFAHGTAEDLAAIEAMGEVFAGTRKPFIIVTGTLAVPKGVLATEDSEPERDGPLSDRAKSGDLIFALSKEKQIRGMVVRFAPVVHGPGDKGFIPNITNAGRQKGSLIYVGDGSARWPACHLDDAAVLLRLALEKGSSGATYHAVAEQGVPTKDMITVAGKRLDLPVGSKSVEEAIGTLGFFAHIMTMDNPTSSDKTQKELGWHPTGPGLLADLEKNYFS